MKTGCKPFKKRQAYTSKYSVNALELVKFQDLGHDFDILELGKYYCTTRIYWKIIGQLQKQFE